MEAEYVTKFQRIAAAQRQKRSNFNLGGKSDYFQTSSAHSYKSSGYLKIPTSSFAKKLSKSFLHFGTNNHVAVPNSKIIRLPKQTYCPASAVPPASCLVLGSSSPIFSTSMHSSYKGLPGDIKDTSLALSIAANLRSHHFSLEVPTVKHNDEGVSDIPKSPIQPAEKKTKIKIHSNESHIEFGKTQIPMATTFSNKFTSQKLSRSCLDEASLKNMKRSHFSLGFGVEKMVSVQHQDFNEKHAEKYHKVPALTQTNFLLGGAKQSFVQSSTLPIPTHKLQDIPQPGPQIKIRDSHFTLGADDISYSTSYIGNQAPSPLPNRSQPALTKCAHLSSTFSFGSSSTPSSLFQSSYKRPIIPLERPTVLKNDLKKHHTNLGAQPAKFKTSSSLIGFHSDNTLHSIKPPSTNSSLSHFKIGSNVSHFLSTTQCDFKPNSLCPVVRKPNLSSKSHFKLSEGTVALKSEQQCQFVWIQPVPCLKIDF